MFLLPDGLSLRIRKMTKIERKFIEYDAKHLVCYNQFDNQALSVLVARSIAFDRIYNKLVWC